MKNDIEKIRTQIEDDYKCDMDKLCIILEQISRVLRKGDNINTLIKGEGLFTDFCLCLYKNGYDNLSASKYLSDWKRQLIMKL